ncbi:MAG: hypothetical protein GY820_31130 [Gammaproteobacteria bacterium]|nr:hypothetical protein [Gammaproteobacteria bacterium]
MFRLVPWWIKVSLKIAISVLPISYERLREFVTGYSGKMADSDYAKKIYMGHYKQFLNQNEQSGAFLELGPGGSLISGVMAIANGFKKAVLIDVGDFASKDIELYKSIFQKYLPEKSNIFANEYKLTGDVIASLRSCGIHYETDGLNSLRKIGTGGVVFSFSNAVLEHVKVGEFAETIGQLYRVHKQGSVSSHRVDFKDHLGGSLNNLRFSRNMWESKYFPNSGFYTNRLRYKDVRDICIDTGFLVMEEKVDEWDQLPLRVNKMSHEFRDYHEKDLLISGADLIIKKPAKSDAKYTFVVEDSQF